MTRRTTVEIAREADTRRAFGVEFRRYLGDMGFAAHSPTPAPIAAPIAAPQRPTIGNSDPAPSAGWILPEVGRCECGDLAAPGMAGCAPCVAARYAYAEARRQAEFRPAPIAPVRPAQLGLFMGDTTL